MLPSIKPGSREAHAYTHLDYVDAARTHGKVSGFAYLSTLVKQIRAQHPGALLLDGGDTWQGSATALWSNGQDMVDAAKLLGVNVMTGHLEFTYDAARVQEVIAQDFKGHVEFLAQNIRTTDFEDPVFSGYTLREINGENLKNLLEDICDNPFNPDPYYQQGGDMVRVGGLQYTCTPTLKIRSRISNMRLNGKPIEPAKNYKLTSWALVTQGARGIPVWDIAASYLREKRFINAPLLNRPTIINTLLGQH